MRARGQAGVMARTAARRNSVAASSPHRRPQTGGEEEKAETAGGEGPFHAIPVDGDTRYLKI